MVANHLFWGSVYLVLAAGYGLLIRYYLSGWRKLPEYCLDGKEQLRTRVTVVIPARNEAPFIDACLRAIQQQDFPSDRLQVIVVDDHSEDDTFAIAGRYARPGWQILRLKPGEGAGKKQALAKALRQAGGELIVTTDADVVAPPGWLRHLTAFYERERPAFFTAPVRFAPYNNLFQRFQALDLLGMMVITGGGIAQGFTQLSNGANLGFSRAAFEAVGGYRDIDHLASGDDVLLMHKMAARFPGRIAFLKARPATVRTAPPPDWRAFLRQRLRWATKSSHYQDRRILPVVIFVFLVCWGILLGPLLAFGHPSLLIWPVSLFLAKSATDFLLLRTAVRFFRAPRLLRVFWPAQCRHIGYIALVGALSRLKKKYIWKGRQVQ